MGIAEECDSMLRCHQNGIHLHPLLQKYAESLKINPQLAAAEMDLFTRTESVVTLWRLQKEMSQRMYPNDYKLIQLALTLPVGTATSERSFSATRWIRNRLRSTMGEERFSSLVILHIEGDLTVNLIPEDIVDIYVNLRER